MSLRQVDTLGCIPFNSYLLPSLKKCKFIQRVNKSENKWSLKKPRHFFFNLRSKQLNIILSIFSLVVIGIHIHGHFFYYFTVIAHRVVH